jgi:hypothetical protein
VWECENWIHSFATFEVLKAVLVFWDVTSCGLMSRYQGNRERNFLHFSLDDGENMFLRKVRIYLRVYMTSQPTRTNSTCINLDRIECLALANTVMKLRDPLKTGNFHHHASDYWFVKENFAPCSGLQCEVPSVQTSPMCLHFLSTVVKRFVMTRVL